VIVWFVGIPIAIAVVAQFVTWAGWAVFGISIFTGFWKLGQLMGWIKPSKRQQEKDEQERRMKYHHYWCARNTAGFARLMGEVMDE
jgi:hypothetical protein